MAWLILVLAGVLEVVWALGLAKTDGFTRLGPSLLVGVALAGSMWLLAAAVRTLPIGTAYAVWVGIGALGTAIGGIVLFGEAVSPARLGFILLLVVAIAGLRMTAGE